MKSLSTASPNLKPRWKQKRRRLVADRGAGNGEDAAKPLPEDVEFMHASREEMVSLESASASPESCSTAARKRKHGRKGPLDFRNTVRHSLSYGGVPAEPKFKYPRPRKTRVDGGGRHFRVGGCIRPLHPHVGVRISNQFSKVRSFVFIDGIDEVTDYFKAVTEDITEAIHANTEADVVC